MKLQVLQVEDKTGHRYLLHTHTHLSNLSSSRNKKKVVHIKNVHRFMLIIYWKYWFRYSMLSSTQWSTKNEACMTMNTKQYIKQMISLAHTYFVFLSIYYRVQEKRRKLLAEEVLINHFFTHTLNFIIYNYIFDFW